MILALLTYLLFIVTDDHYLIVMTRRLLPHYLLTDERVNSTEGRWLLDSCLIYSYRHA